MTTDKWDNYLSLLSLLVNKLRDPDAFAFWGGYFEPTEYSDFCKWCGIFEKCEREYYDLEAVRVGLSDFGSALFSHAEDEENRHAWVETLEHRGNKKKQASETMEGVFWPEEKGECRLGMAVGYPFYKVFQRCFSRRVCASMGTFFYCKSGNE